MKFKLRGKPPQAPKSKNVYNFKTWHVFTSLALMVNVFIFACIEYGNPIAATMITSAVSTSIIFFYFMMKDMLE